MTAIVVSTVTAIGAVLVALIERGRRQNSREHGQTMHRLDKVLTALGRVEHKVDTHISDHKDGTL